jgi:hypothetical protein
MLVLAVLLAQAVAPPLDDEGPLVPLGDIAGLQRRWEELHSACRKLPVDSVEGQNACHARDVARVELGRRGWCLRQSGIRIEWDMCPRR